MITDVLSLAALQPEGAVAAEAVRSEVKAVVREGAKTLGRDLVTTGSEAAGKALARSEAGAGLGAAARVGESAAGKRLARWWSVASAGGLYQVLRRWPEALPRLSLAQLSEMAGPLASKAGLRLSQWRALRLLKDGAAGRGANSARARRKIRGSPGCAGRGWRDWVSQDGRVPEKSASRFDRGPIATSHRLNGLSQFRQCEAPAEPSGRRPSKSVAPSQNRARPFRLRPIKPLKAPARAGRVRLARIARHQLFNFLSENDFRRAALSASFRVLEIRTNDTTERGNPAGVTLFPCVTGTATSFED